MRLDCISKNGTLQNVENCKNHDMFKRAEVLQAVCDNWPVCEEPAGERKRTQPSPSPGWPDQPPSRAPSRSAGHPTTAPDVTRIDIFPDSNGNPATRSGPAFALTTKPPRSTFTRSVDQSSRNSSAQKKPSRSGTSASATLHPSRSADSTKGRSKQTDGRKVNSKFGGSVGDVNNDENDDDDGAEDDDDGGSGVYCVIRSGVTPRTRTRRQVAGALTKHQFRQVCARPHQAVVFTADTASLLLRSGPPLLIRPATDVSLNRSTTRSAIQRVTDVNYLTELHGLSRSKSGIESSSRRGQDLYRARLALGRSSSLKSADLNQSHKDAASSKENLAPASVLQRATSEEIVCRKSSAEVKKKRLDTQQVAYISRDSSAARRQNQRTSGQTHAQSEPSSSATSVNMANRQQLKKAPQQKSRPAQQGEAPAGNQKTLIPSKHGFHPRSHSPTFKRLIAASERLQETQPGAHDSSVNAASVSSYPVDSYPYGSSSSDSLRDLRTTFSQDQVNGMLYADRDSNDNIAKDNSNSKKDANSSSPPYLRERKTRATHKHHTVSRQQPSLPVADTGERRGRGEVREARLVKRKTQSHVMRQRHDVSFDRQHQHRALAEDNTSSTAPGPLDHHSREPQAYTKRTSRLPEPGGGEHAPPTSPPTASHYGIEMEARVREGQPTQLHFFLPQLADGMSDGSGGNLTGRSNYRDRRLELLDWRDSRGSASDGGLHHDSSAPGPGGALYLDNEENDPTSTTTITEIQTNNRSNSKSKHHHPPRPEQQTIRDPAPHRTNGHRGASKERITAYDLKHGHLTLNRGRQSPQYRDEGASLYQPHKHKRHISPLRANPQKVAEKPARNRRASNSPYRAPVYLESQLPSEKLKKQIEDFPTLVSMDYSDTDTSLQVR
ncbi:hypothetical protein ElyMa_003372700 [Elysia marginata]|uniref:Uncharacterized protein n=1 Tax=Elysia marginata TaxID=1093978 RepID=A0AAV4JK43_9GAST|nr:hypothetical protein ElyMa_003372700 [Elysia marginata]